jgi:sialate O-acetylesterase
MVHPLAPFAIRGAIWYQGESNCLSADGMMYHHKMKALIEGWRKVWNQDEMPFYFVQLAPFNYARYDTSPFELPKIWEAQTESLFLPNTGMAVTTDIGDVSDIHPRNKQDVGKRLALWALANAYGRSDLVHSGPLYRSMAVDSTRIRISFDHVGSGLMSRDGQPLTWFEIAGADSQFVEAQAVIEEDQVVVWSEGVPEPIAVRFGWHEEAVPNLSNQEGLPASPFRTHRW